MESYPPTIEDLRKSFLALHPGYEFGVALSGSARTICPLEPVGSIDRWGNLIRDHFGLITHPIITQNGVRYEEWIKYIHERAKLIAEEAGVLVPKEGQMSDDPHRRLFIYVQMFNEICGDPNVTQAKRLEREKVREEGKRLAQERKERQEKELAAAKEWALKTGWKSKGEHMYSRQLGISEEDARLMQAYQTFIRCSSEEEARVVKRLSRISTLVKKSSFTEQESEVILAHLYPSDGFKKDTLLALKALNRFANENGIRVEDAVVVIREYALSISWSKI